MRTVAHLTSSRYDPALSFIDREVGQGSREQRSSLVKHLSAVIAADVVGYVRLMKAVQTGIRRGWGLPMDPYCARVIDARHAGGSRLAAVRGRSHGRERTIDINTESVR